MRNSILDSTFPFDDQSESDLAVLRYAEGEPDAETLETLETLEALEVEKTAVTPVAEPAPAPATITPDPNKCFDAMFAELGKATVQKEATSASGQLNRLMGRTADTSTGNAMGRPKKGNSRGLNQELRQQVKTGRAMSKAITFPTGTRFKLTFHDSDSGEESLSFDVILAGPALISIDPDAPEQETKT